MLKTFGSNPPPPLRKLTGRVGAERTPDCGALAVPQRTLHRTGVAEAVFISLSGHLSNGTL